MIEEKIKVNISGGLDFQLPNMIKIRQKFSLPKLNNVYDEILKDFNDKKTNSRIKPGMTVAIGCGSRGIANISEATKAVVDFLLKCGAKPFIFPAMGSHGGATADGQVKVLADYGISEDSMGCPIKSSMEVVELSKLDTGMPIYIDKHASEADGIVVISRIKPHTNFRAPIESGIVKMLTIGMGKIAGATELHSYGMDTFIDLLPKACAEIISKKNILFGVGLVENAADETAIAEIVHAENIFSREIELQKIAKNYMPRLLFDEIDVLVIDQIGKNISGAGMDPNITGRNSGGVKWDVKPDVKKIVVLGLTPETHGNATGIGMADVITYEVYKDLDISKTYANVITSTYLDGAAIPVIMNTSEEAIKLAAKTVNRVKVKDLKIVRIKNTLELIHIEVSENMIDIVSSSNNSFELIGKPYPWKF
tara:strand:+ start:471 stop:1739 length:1269 start_codon:yes stop_codon:yes gene_type:complete